MKITIELDENLPDDEIRIHCRRMTEELQKIQEAFASGLSLIHISEPTRH